MENYYTAVLNSFREVENGLASTKSAALRKDAFGDGFKEATSAYQISKEIYEEGASDFLDLLEVQKNLLSIESAYAFSQFEMLIACVDLYKALGGGWCEAPSY